MNNQELIIQCVCMCACMCTCMVNEDNSITEVSDMPAYSFPVGATRMKNIRNFVTTVLTLVYTCVCVHWHYILSPLALLGYLCGNVSLNLLKS
jgi:hypothetical protein